MTSLGTSSNTRQPAVTVVASQCRQQLSGLATEHPRDVWRRRAVVTHSEGVEPSVPLSSDADTGRCVFVYTNTATLQHHHNDKRTHNPDGRTHDSDSLWPVTPRQLCLPLVVYQTYLIGACVGSRESPRVLPLGPLIRHLLLRRPARPGMHQP